MKQPPRWPQMTCAGRSHRRRDSENPTGSPRGAAPAGGRAVRTGPGDRGTDRLPVGRGMAARQPGADASPLRAACAAKAGLSAQGHSRHRRTLAGVEAIVIELSLLEYNKGGPLIGETMRWLGEQGFALFDVFPLSRIPAGALLQVDGVFLRRGSSLWPKAPFFFTSLPDRRTNLKTVAPQMVIHLSRRMPLSAGLRCC